uniref:C2H2-type domain-containing protein n=1 Tax=Leersia perrieri TaxID=77586 RepID=A0A0D9X653_9ORYZ
MEFRYRAGDDRSRSPPSPATASSGSADGFHAHDCGTGDYGGDSGVAPCSQPPASLTVTADAVRDELRQAKKEKIRERILREEAEDWELEAEVRRELMEQIFPLLRRSGNNNAPPAGATSAVQVVSKANASASAAILPTKRKNPAVATASASAAVSAETSSKRPKADLTCAVCGITSTGEKALQDHLNGKSHKKKAAAAALAMPAEPEKDDDQMEVEEEEADDDAAAMMMMMMMPPPASDDGFVPTKLTMRSHAGEMYNVMQMDGYLLCEACNVRAADRVTMMCHLNGSKHVSKSKATKLNQQSGKPAPATLEEGGQPGTVVVEAGGEKHVVRRLDVDGFLLCEACNVKAPSLCVMQSHLVGKKHKSSMSAAAVAKGKAETATAANAGGSIEAAQVTGSAMEVVKDVVVADDAPGEEAKNIVVAAAAPVVPGPATASLESFDMIVDGERHAVTRIGDFLGCTPCNVKATSESDMRLHLRGKKHKTRSASPFASFSVKPPSPPRDDVVTARADADGSAAPPKIADSEAPPGAATGQEMRIQVGGRLFVVLRQANGALLCEPCGVRCDGKTDMVFHLYTQDHLARCGVAAHQPEVVEEKKPATVATPPASDDGGEQ